VVVDPAEVVVEVFNVVDALVEVELELPVDDVVPEKVLLIAPTLMLE
jgi:hypothetical protein